MSDEAAILPAKVEQICCRYRVLGRTAPKLLDDRLAVNATIMHQLSSIQVLKGYSGDFINGIHIGDVQESE